MLGVALVNLLPYNRRESREVHCLEIQEENMLLLHTLTLLKAETVRHMEVVSQITKPELPTFHHQGTQYHVKTAACMQVEQRKTAIAY